MHDFLAITENQNNFRTISEQFQNNFRAIAGKLSDKNKWEIAIRNFHHSEQE